jgi:hypothetical protein
MPHEWAGGDARQGETERVRLTVKPVVEAPDRDCTGEGPAVWSGKVGRAMPHGEQALETQAGGPCVDGQATGQFSGCQGPPHVTLSHSRDRAERTSPPTLVHAAPQTG